MKGRGQTNPTRLMKNDSYTVLHHTRQKADIHIDQSIQSQKPKAKKAAGGRFTQTIPNDLEMTQQLLCPAGTLGVAVCCPSEPSFAVGISLVEQLVYHIATSYSRWPQRLLRYRVSLIRETAVDRRV